MLVPASPACTDLILTPTPSEIAVTVFKENPELDSDSESDYDPVTVCIYETPSEVVSLTIAGLAARYFLPILAPPLIGGAIGILLGKILVKAIDKVDRKYKTAILTNFAKQACEFSNKYPQLQIITMVVAIVFGCLSNAIGWIAGLTAGGFGGTMIEVENLRLQQLAGRSVKTL